MPVTQKSAGLSTFTQHKFAKYQLTNAALLTLRIADIVLETLVLSLN